MATEQPAMVLLRDEDGTLYAINRERLQEFRLPAEVQARVEQALAGEAVSGYTLGTAALPVVSFSWGAVATLPGSPLQPDHLLEPRQFPKTSPKLFGS